MYEKLEDQKCKSKTDIQCNGQKKKDKRTHNCLQTITQKTKDRVTRTPLKTGMNSGAPERSAVLVPHVAPFVLLFVTNDEKS